MNILGIETSCDETAAAVVKDGRVILSNVVASQIDLHRQFGGVVPEVAARSHLEVILPIIEKALCQAFSVESSESSVVSKISKARATRYPLPATRSAWTQIDGIAVTYGPGLPGALLVGTLTARTLALTLNKPIYAIDHVMAHAYAAFLQETGARSLELENNQENPSANSHLQTPNFPILALIVSGGHTQLVLWQDHFKYKLLGQTLDDAAGEAFDKMARVLGLEPSGRVLANAAAKGDWQSYEFPLPKTEGEYDFSFSGLKTAGLRHLQKLINKDYTFPSFKIATHLSKHQINDTAASFEHAVVDYLAKKTLKAAREHNPASIVLAGGVAANKKLRNKLHNTFGNKLIIPPVNLCTDNAAMVAALGYWHAQQGKALNPLELETNPSLSM